MPFVVTDVSVCNEYDINSALIDCVIWANFKTPLPIFSQEFKIYHTECAVGIYAICALMSYYRL